MQSLAEWKFGSCNVGDKKKKKKGKPRTASAYGRAVKKTECRTLTAPAYGRAVKKKPECRTLTAPAYGRAVKKEIHLTVACHRHPMELVQQFA